MEEKQTECNPTEHNFTALNLSEQDEAPKYKLFCTNCGKTKEFK